MVIYSWLWYIVYQNKKGLFGAFDGDARSTERRAGKTIPRGMTLQFTITIRKEELDECVNN